MPAQESPEWLFFDCFGTLIDEHFENDPHDTGIAWLMHLPMAAGFYPSRAAFEADYLVWRAAEWTDERWHEVTLHDRLEAIFTHWRPIPQPRRAQLIAEMLAAFERGYPASLAEMPGARAMLEAWRGKVRMAVVSNHMDPGSPARMLKRFGLLPYFDFVLDSATFGWKKPGTRIYHEALRLAGLTPADAGRVTFIGDNLHNDVEVPLALGFRAVFLHRRSAPPPALPPGVELIMDWERFRPDRHGA